MVCLAAPSGKTNCSAALVSDGVSCGVSCGGSWPRAGHATQSVAATAKRVDLVIKLSSRVASLSLPVGELLGEGGDGLGVDLRRVPLQQHLEIGRAFAPWLATLPAVAFEIIRRRGQHVGHAVDEVAAAVAVVVDGEFQIGRRQELGLADLAGPGAVHVGWRHVAAVDDLERGKHLAAELVRPAAIEGQRNERADGGEVAIVGAVVGLQPPDGDNDRARHAELLLDLAEGRAVLGQHLGAAGEPWRYHAAGELLEALPEHALSVVAGDDRRIGGDAAEAGLDRALRNTLRSGFRLDALQPSAEIAAARRRGLCRCTDAAEQKQAAGGNPFPQNNTGSHVWSFQAPRSEAAHWVAIMMPQQAFPVYGLPAHRDRPDKARGKAGSKPAPRRWCNSRRSVL